MKHLEIKTIEHKGVKVIVQIDFDNEKITLVEEVMRQYEKKHWVFADRGLDYMQGWQNVLDAMKFAVAQATKDLRDDQESRTKEKNRMKMLVNREIKKAEK